MVIIFFIVLVACRPNPNGKSHADGELNILLNEEHVCLAPNFDRVYVGYNDPRRYELKYLTEVVVRINYDDQEPVFLEMESMSANEKLCYDKDTSIYKKIKNSPEDKPPFIVIFGLSDKKDRHVSFKKIYAENK